MIRKLMMCLALLTVGLAGCFDAPRMAKNLYALEEVAIDQCKVAAKGCAAKGECVARIKSTLDDLYVYTQDRAEGKPVWAMTVQAQYDATVLFCKARGVTLSQSKVKP